MENTKNSKFENLASHFHDEYEEKLNENIIKDNDFKAVEKLFNLREKVMHLALLKSKEEAWRKIHNKLFGRYIFSANKNYKIILLVAALSILIVLTGILSKIIYRPSSSEETESLTQIVTSTGEMKEVLLPDGTSVFLSANSTLNYDNSFGQKNRNIELNGEGLFDIKMEESLPFLVKINNGLIKVHGTKFILTSYSGRNKNEIILLDGKVQYQSDKNNFFLDKGDRLIDNMSSGETIRDKIIIDNYNEWQLGKVYFDNQNLNDLAFLLEQWYGIRFIFSSDDLRYYKFTGHLNKKDKLEYNLNIIELTNKVKFNKTGKGVISIN